MLMRTNSDPNRASSGGVDTSVILARPRHLPPGPTSEGGHAKRKLICWARWMRDVYGAKSEKAQWLRFHTQTAGVSLTAQQPYNNVVRTAVEALAAVLGGTNSLHTNALDETLALPSEQAAEIALRTQQVLMEETGGRVLAKVGAEG